MMRHGFVCIVSLGAVTIRSIDIISQIRASGRTAIFRHTSGSHVVLCNIRLSWPQISDQIFGRVLIKTDLASGWGLPTQAPSLA